MSKTLKGSGRPKKQRVRSAKGRPVGSSRWLARQLNDPYVASAKNAGLRSRAAYKLIELDDRFGLLKPGMAVVDLGAAPGGWTQVAVDRVGTLDGNGRVVAVDLLGMEPVPGATVITGDYADASVYKEISAALGGQASVVLSDMAGSATGHAQTDSIRVLGLCEGAADFAQDILSSGGTFMCKLIQGADERPLMDMLKKSFDSVRLAKPPASRADSAEIYLLCRNYSRQSRQPATL